MICPHCKAEDQSTILSTRTRSYGIKRVRRCLVCGSRFATIEINKITEEAVKSLKHSIKLLKTKERERNEKV